MRPVGQVAVADCEPGIATGLLLLIARRLSLPSGGNTATISGRFRQGRRGCVRRLSLGAQDHQGHGCGKKQVRHVSLVSTKRRAKARNSGDCISCKRDTVRGNSCANGPSV